MRQPEMLLIKVIRDGANEQAGKDSVLPKFSPPGVQIGVFFEIIFGIVQIGRFSEMQGWKLGQNECQPFWIHCQYGQRLSLSVSLWYSLQATRQLCRVQTLWRCPSLWAADKLSAGRRWLHISISYETIVNPVGSTSTLCNPKSQRQRE